LTSSPVFQSSVQWGTTHVGDRLIVPSTAYTVQAEVTAGTSIGSAAATTWAWGNANNVDDVNVFDIVCALDGFQGIFTNCTPYGVDQNQGTVAHPVTVDMGDVIAVLDAFAGTTYPDGAPCSAFAFTDSVRRFTSRAGPSGTLTLSPSATTIVPGGTVRVDVYGDGLSGVRAYQVALEITGLTGTLTASEASIEAGRKDGLFGGFVSVPVADTAGARIGNALWDSATTQSDRAYLGSFVLRADANASGTFHIGFKEAATLLWGTAPSGAPAETSSGIDITVKRRAQ
jgi:hypothetical protein